MNGSKSPADDAARAAVERAQVAATQWQVLNARQRARRLLDFRDLLIDRADEIVAVVCEETHKPRFDVLGELFHVAGLIGWLARKGPRLMRPRSVWPSLLWNKAASVAPVPYGVIGVISPWNYPIVLTLAPTMQALLAGNAVVVKPSERTPRLASLLQDLIIAWSPDLPVVQILFGGPEAAMALVRAGMGKVFFTGGVEGGRAIAKAAAERLTPVVLELGGNDPMIVCADADLDRAARGAVWGAFLNAGQSCAAVERCYVEASVATAFLEKLVARTGELQLGSGGSASSDKDYDVGPLVDLAQFERINQLLQDAVDLGAKVLLGGSGDFKTLVFEPTILVDVPPTARLLREEIFGPILPVIVVQDVDEAIALANQSPYGLSASIWTRDRRRGRAIAERLSVGGMVINDCMIHFGIAELPFGGVKSSGFGRTQGPQGLMEFCVLKTTTVHRFGPKRQFNWFPYGSKHRLLRRFLRLIYRRGLWKRFSNR